MTEFLRIRLLVKGDSMTSSAPTPEFARNADDEAFLRQLNDTVAVAEESGYRDDLPEVWPTLHVIGVPRSGTTLLSQLIAAHLDVAYVDHVVASFWRAPVTGLRLSRKLLGSERAATTYQSNCGRTDGLHEPHEFGYFWEEHLRNRAMNEPSPEFEASLDWRRFRRVLLNMTHAAGRPIAFKSFPLAWHIARMQQELPRTCFVRIRRNRVDNAMSLLSFRQKQFGTIETWGSARPKQYVWLQQRPVWEQVAGQVHYLERSHDRHVASVKGRNVIDVEYDQLCRDPKGVLEAIAAMLEQNGSPTRLLSDPPATFEESSGGGKWNEYRDRIQAATDWFATGQAELWRVQVGA